MASKDNVIVLGDFIRTTNKGGVRHVANFLDYIARREGTDLSLSLQEAQRETENISKIDSVIENGNSNTHLLNHLDYMGNREGVVKDGAEIDHGLFDAHGIPDIDAVRKEVRGLNKTPVYRFVISLREETAQKLDFTDKDAWSRMARNSMPFVAEQMRIPLEHFNWVCAYHIKDGHPHVHVASWDKRDIARPNGWEKIPEKNFTQIRSIFVNNVNRERSLELSIVKDEMRKYITNNLRNDAEEIKRFLQYGESPDLKNQDKTAIMSLSDRKFLGQHIKEISQVLPKKGSSKYKYLQPEVKAVVDKAVDDALKIDKFKGRYEQYLSTQREMISMYRSEDDAIQEKVDKADTELRKERIANIIIDQAKEYAIYKDNLRNKIIDEEIQSATMAQQPKDNQKLKEIDKCAADIKQEIKSHNEEIKKAASRAETSEDLKRIESQIVPGIPAPDDKSNSSIVDKHTINDIEYSLDEKLTIHNVCRQRLNSLENIMSYCKKEAEQQEIKKLMFLYRKYSLLTGRSSDETLRKMIEINKQLDKPLPLNELVRSTNQAEINNWSKSVQIKSTRGFIKSLNVSQDELNKYSPATKNEQDFRSGKNDLSNEQEIKEINKQKDNQRQEQLEAITLASFGSRLFRDIDNMINSAQPSQSPSKVLDKLRGKQRREAEINRNR